MFTHSYMIYVRSEIVFFAIAVCSEISYANPSFESKVKSPKIQIIVTAWVIFDNTISIRFLYLIAFLYERLKYNQLHCLQAIVILWLIFARILYFACGNTSGVYLSTDGYKQKRVERETDSVWEREQVATAITYVSATVAWKRPVDALALCVYGYAVHVFFNFYDYSLLLSRVSVCVCSIRMSGSSIQFIVVICR